MGLYDYLEKNKEKMISCLQGCIRIPSRYADDGSGCPYGQNLQNCLEYVLNLCEELGFVGALAIIALFCALILRGYWIALRARDRFSTVLAAGLVTLIAVQTVLNLCVVTNLLPSHNLSQMTLIENSSSKEPSSFSS